MVYYIPLQRKYTDLPVAQLDSASDSDSEGQRFESVRVGQRIDRGARLPCLFFSYPFVNENRSPQSLAIVCMGSESVRVGQKTQETAQPSLVFFRLFNRSREPLHHNRPAVVRMGSNPSLVFFRLFNRSRELLHHNRPAVVCMGSKPVIALRRICPSKKQVS